MKPPTMSVWSDKTAQILGLSTWQGIFCLDVSRERETRESEREPAGKRNITLLGKVDIWRPSSAALSMFSLKMIFIHRYETFFDPSENCLLSSLQTLLLLFVLLWWQHLRDRHRLIPRVLRNTHTHACMHTTAGSHCIHLAILNDSKILPTSIVGLNRYQKSSDILYFCCCQHEKSQLMLLTNLQAHTSLCHRACCSKTIKNTSVSPTVPLGDMFLYFNRTNTQ